MADYVVSSSPSFINLHSWRRSRVKEKAPSFTPNYLHSQRKYSHRNCKVVQVSTQKTCGLLSFKASPVTRKNSIKCYCLGSLVDPNGAIVSGWVSVSDQLLLMASIFLTYMAGVIPQHNSNHTHRNNFLEDNVVVESSTSSGSYRKKDDRVNLKHAWDAVKEKLLDSIDAIERRSSLGNKFLQLEQQHAKRPLSLFAIFDGPKLRLLWASFQWLKEEVKNIFAESEAFSMDDWLTIFPEIIQKSCHPVCMAWLVEELQLENKKSLFL
ncbi:PHOSPHOGLYCOLATE PHOSPHATASE [Salix koriyanagi]|uniref:PHOSPHOGLYCOLATE PHOSPHATASE n=1 Tax=Salix koriyanagi TaxID=2511006 RepID=A0A9Q0TG11_9ROSI|nr:PHOSPHOGLYCOLATE PHOSPHATASE [Salix koriyanagi]